MTDSVSRETRSRIMAAERGGDTKPEIALRRALHARGMRYRVSDRRLPGTPDVVFPRHRTALFVHGCFWHRHGGCSKATTPKTNVEFWSRKFMANVERDRRALSALNNDGWKTVVVWQCGIRKVPPAELVDRIVEFVQDADEVTLELPIPS